MALDILQVGQDAKDMLERTKDRLTLICMLILLALFAILLEAEKLSIACFLCAAYSWFLLLNAKIMEGNSWLWKQRFANITHTFYDLTLMVILVM